MGEVTSEYASVHGTDELVQGLLARHERVQEAKGKRPWFEQTRRGFVVRPLYRTGSGRGIDAQYIHPYRINALRSFLMDVR